MNISWHRDTWRLQFGRRQAIPQSLLLCGSAGAGLDQFAEAVAQAAVCEHPHEDGAPCGQCLDCQWAIGRRHPDLLWLGESVEGEEPVAEEAVEATDSAAKPASKRLINVSQVRDLVSFFRAMPHRDRARVAVLNPAETMNLAAANALLKVLEEPPRRGHLVLVSRNPARLPATVRSRCRTLRLPRPDPGQALAWLREEGVPSPELALAQTGGAPLAARDLPPAYWEARSGLLPLLARGPDCGATPPDAEAAHIVELMQSWCFDLAAVRWGGIPRYHPDFKTALAALSGRVVPDGLRELENRLRDSRRLLDHPLNPKLAMESLLIAYAHAFKET